MSKKNNHIKTWYLYLPDYSQKYNRYKRNSFLFDQWRLTDDIKYPVITYQNKPTKGDITNGK